MEEEPVVNRPMYPAFLYDEPRVFNKVCLFVKTMGFGLYTGGACMCVIQSKQPTMFSSYCIMLVGMFASNCNTARYEYAFHKKCGTMFHSIREFHAWKTQQLPKLSYAFDVVEMLIKLYVIIAEWPLKFTTHNDETDTFSICELSMTGLKIHIIILFIIYFIAIVFGMCFYLMIQIRTNEPIETIETIETIEINEITECCICLNRNAKPWTTTRCAHKFHRDCLSTWTRISATCPVCRTNLAPNALSFN